MAKILNNVAFNRQIQKIVETEKGLVINGHYYNRDNMTPVPFSAVPTYGSCNDLAMNQKLVLKSNAVNKNKTQGDMVIIDQNNPNIKYVFTVSTKGENIQTILKLDESNGKCNYINYVTLSSIPTTNGYVSQVVGQSDDFLFVLFETNSFRTYFYKIDKNSLGLTSIKDYSNYNNVYGLYENENYIYFGINNIGQNHLDRYSKTNNAITRISSTNNGASSLQFDSRFSKIIKIDDEHFYTYSIRYTNAEAKLSIIRFDYDLTKESDYSTMITETVVDTTYTSEIAKIPTFANNYYVIYEPFITYATNGKKYLNISVHEIYPTSTVANYPSYGIYTFLIDESNDGALKLKGFTNFGNTPHRGFLGIKNNNTIVVASDQSLFFANFSTDTESFVLSETKNITPQHVGIDRQENIWYVTGTGEVEFTNSASVNSVCMSFEKGNYVYDGSDLSTYIEVCTKNIDGELIASNLQLIITGEATWNTNNTKTVNIQTSADNVVQVPLTIKDKGNITILPKIIM